MAPMQTEMNLPTGYSVTPRENGPRDTDRRPVLRDREGRVLAWVERVPEDAVN